MTPFHNDSPSRTLEPATVNPILNSIGLRLMKLGITEDINNINSPLLDSYGGIFDQTGDLADIHQNHSSFEELFQSNSLHSCSDYFARQDTDYLKAHDIEQVESMSNKYDTFDISGIGAKKNNTQDGYIPPTLKSQSKNTLKEELSESSSFSLEDMQNGFQSYDHIQNISNNDNKKFIRTPNNSKSVRQTNFKINNLIKSNNFNNQYIENEVIKEFSSDEHIHLSTEESLKDFKQRECDSIRSSSICYNRFLPSQSFNNHRTYHSSLNSNKKLNSKNIEPVNILSPRLDTKILNSVADLNNHIADLEVFQNQLEYRVSGFETLSHNLISSIKKFLQLNSDRCEACILDDVISVLSVVDITKYPDEAAVAIEKVILESDKNLNKEKYNRQKLTPVIIKRDITKKNLFKHNSNILCNNSDINISNEQKTPSLVNTELKKLQLSNKELLEQRKKYNKKFTELCKKLKSEHSMRIKITQDSKRLLHEQKNYIHVINQERQIFKRILKNMNEYYLSQRYNLEILLTNAAIPFPELQNISSLNKTTVTQQSPRSLTDKENEKRESEEYLTTVEKHKVNKTSENTRQNSNKSRQPKVNQILEFEKDISSNRQSSLSKKNITPIQSKSNLVTERLTEPKSCVKEMLAKLRLGEIK